MPDESKKSLSFSSGSAVGASSLEDTTLLVSGLRNVGSSVDDMSSLANRLARPLLEVSSLSADVTSSLDCCGSVLSYGTEE